MKIHFSCFSGNIFYRSLWIFGILVCFVACHNKQQKPPRPEFTLETPGGRPAEMWNDTAPKVVYYYKLDEEGNPTQERIGVAEFYQNKQEYVSGGLKDGKKDGKWYAFHNDGSVFTETFYVDGKHHGIYNLYRDNGHPLLKGHYNHGICDGTWSWYDEAGKQTKKIKADGNTIACEWCAKCMKLKY
ncbi:MAG: hypothetical protein FWC34_01840 [Bacteroidetes bacterium]|nr:hypothetical protein [Bacteroidota bacterium]MCL2303606.1 hypothetical protein [Lentimicrobiaceae bacterium]